MLKSIYYDIFAVALVLALVRPSTGQSAASMPAPPPPITRPGSITDSGLYDYWTEMSGQGRAGGVLLGKLELEGGELPWQPIPVSVVCNGSILNTTQTDAKGRFVIKPTVVPGLVSVEKDQERQMETRYQGCLVEASLAGFQSTALTITQKNFLTAPDLGTITLSRTGGTGTAVSQTSQSAPGGARRAFEKARADWIEHKPDRAQQDLEKAVEIYPQFAEAWYVLGSLQENSNLQEAENSYSKSVAGDPKFVLPYERLAAIYAQQGKWKEVVEDSGHAIQLDPVGTAQNWYLDALGNYQLGKMDEAETSATKSLAMDPRHTILNTEQLLAVVLVQKKDYAGALAHLKNALTYMPSGPNADLLKQQIEQIERATAAAK